MRIVCLKSKLTSYTVQKFRNIPFSRFMFSSEFFKSCVHKLNVCKIPRERDDSIFHEIIILNAGSSLTFKVNNQFLLMNH